MHFVSLISQLYQQTGFVGTWKLQSSHWKFKEYCCQLLVNLVLSLIWFLITRYLLFHFDTCTYMILILIFMITQNLSYSNSCYASILKASCIQITSLNKGDSLSVSWCIEILKNKWLIIWCNRFSNDKIVNVVVLFAQ